MRHDAKVVVEDHLFFTKTSKLLLAFGCHPRTQGNVCSSFFFFFNLQKTIINSPLSLFDMLLVTWGGLGTWCFPCSLQQINSSLSLFDMLLAIGMGLGSWRSPCSSQQINSSLSLFDMLLTTWWGLGTWCSPCSLPF